MLRHPSGSVDYFAEHPVIQFLESFANHSPGLPLIVRPQVLHIFEQDSGRPFGLDNRCQLEKERPLGGVAEAMLTAEAVFLRHAGKGKWLAGETGREKVVVGDGGQVEVADIAMRCLAKPRFVCLTGVFVPFAGEETLAAELLQRHPESSDAGEKVDKGKPGR